MSHRFIGLSKIPATDPLAQLFNAYFKELNTLALTAEPSYLTMAELRQGFYGGTRKQKKEITQDAIRHYGLMVLFNSLEAIHGHVLGAIEVLETFFAQYEGNLTLFAIKNRLQMIEKYGGEDDDYTPPAPGKEDEPWPIAYKDDSESLKHYSLYSELERFFGDGGTRGEYLGLSAHTDFYPYTAVVEQASEFSLRKMFSAFSGQEVTFTTIQSDGHAVPMTLGDHIESEMNEDIRNGTTVENFNRVLFNLQGAGDLFRRPTMRATTEPYLYTGLLNLLVSFRDMTIITSSKN